MSRPDGWQKLPNGTFAPPTRAVQTPPVSQVEVPEQVQRSVIRDGAVLIRDADDKIVVLIGKLDTGEYGLEIYDDDGNVRLVIGKTGDDDYGLNVFDTTGLGVAQGHLGVGVVDFDEAPIALTGTPADIEGGSVTFTVGTGRRIKTTAYVHITNQDASPRSSFIQILDEDDTTLITDSAGHDALGGGNQAGQTLVTVLLNSPPAGEHTYRLQASINGGSGVLVSESTNPSFLSVEDIGPAE